MLAILLAMTLSPSLSPAQPDAAHLQRDLERLSPGARVLYVAAHPDDENTRLLAWLTQVKKLRVGYLSITRGDGGQNLIGKEQGPALGLIRTQELLAARRLDGAEQFFTRARDFGYSKSPEEALRIWGHERILEDVVQVLRTFKPDVVVTRFSPVPSETHGHHTASAQLAVEAFAKAADKSFAPRLAPWQARRVVWNAFLDEHADKAKFIQQEANVYDPLLGLSMGELAGDSRTMHKSQGFGASRLVAPTVEFFQLLAGEPMQQSPLDGLAATPPPRVQVRPDAPAEALPALLAQYAAAPSEDLAQAIVWSAGLSLAAIADNPVVAPGVELPVTLTATQRTAPGLELVSVSLNGAPLAGPGAIAVGKPWVQKASIAKLPAALASDPAWVRNPPEDGWYPVEAFEDRIRPEPAPPLWADFTLRAGAQTLTLRRPVVYRWVDPVLGERTRAVEIAPPATIDAVGTLLFPTASARTLQVTVRASAGPVAGTALVEPPPGFTVEPASRPFALAAAGDELELPFEVRPAAGARAGQLRLAVKIGDAVFDRGLRRIEYAHIPWQTWHPRSQVRLVRFDLARGGTRIGYVEGAGDEVPKVLAQLGYQITPLDEAALRERDLSGFDAIVLGVRAFNTRPWLAALKPRLFDYVARGGVLVEQYNTLSRQLPEPLGPYPMSLSHLRVTDETATVTAADDAVLRAPNVIGPADFEGWVQERGLYFAEKWDSHYAAPLTMHDPGEPPLRGSLLIARHGKGRFVYTGLAFFRQLPAGVPGAIRLFANLLAH
jgi:LmbE family N-acetylglucosaminyl deacetylase